MQGARMTSGQGKLIQIDSLDLDPAIEDIVETMVAQVHLCISLFVGASFTNFHEYDTNVLCKMPCGDVCRNDFLNRIHDWQLECEGPLKRALLLFKKPMKIRNFFEKYDGDDIQDLHSRLLEVMSTLLLDCCEQVGEETLERMEKWFDFMNAKSMFTAAENMSATFLESKKKQLLSENIGEMPELFTFDYRTLFLYTSQIVYLECTRPGYTSVTLPGGGPFAYEYSLPDTVVQNLESTRIWQFKMSRHIDELFKLKVGLYPIDGDGSAHLPFIEDLPCVHGDEQNFDHGTPHIHKFHLLMCKCVFAKVNHFVAANSASMCHCVNIYIHERLEAHLELTVAHIQHQMDLVRAREKGRRNYRKSTEGIAEKRRKFDPPPFQGDDVHLFGFQSYHMCAKGIRS